MRTLCTPKALAILERLFHAARYPSAPSSAMSSVIDFDTLPSSAAAASSIASFAMIRYVVHLPPATTTRPGTLWATMCSRLSFEVWSDSPASNGRSPA